MPSVAILEKEKQQVSNITESLKNSRIVIFANYAGMTANEMSDFRKELKKEQITVKVNKNKLTRRALKEFGNEAAGEKLVGPLITIQSESDAVTTSKKIVDFNKSNEKFEIKMGFLGNELIEESTIVKLSKIPSREELIAKLLGSLNSPIAGFVNCLAGPMRGLVCSLNAIKDQKPKDD